MNTFNFNERLNKSNDSSIQEEIKEILMAIFPYAIDIQKADLQADIKGTDYWVRFKYRKVVSIDVKVRDTDPLEMWGKNDLALETFSDKERETVGWTRDEKKNTDYVLWYFSKTKRYVILPYLLLQSIFVKNWENWKEQYKNDTQDSSEWKSECIFVPLDIILKSIYEEYC